MAPTAPQPQAPSQAYAQFPGAYGQPFQPYSQYGAPQPQAAQQIIRTEPTESKGWKITRSALHGAGIVVAILCIALSFSFKGTTTEVFTAWYSSPAAFIAFVWSLAELIVRAVRKQKEGIHPGAHVGVCLLIWLAASFVAGVYSTFAAISHYGDRSSNCDYRYDSSIQDYTYYNCTLPFNGRFGQWIALTVFSWLLWLIYFILFVGSCIDTHKRNQAKRQQVVIVNPGSFWGAGQGWQQLPQGAQIVQAAAPGISLGNRDSTQPQNPLPTEFYSEKGKEPQRLSPTHQPAAPPQITEYYTPSASK
ncbi:unnamed protein product [Clonostachys rosea]|uniref:MARVEL domain-containing protein n=1 Tax=Bionectria ochroleuca TaxID=29856 RepID=A0ABY6TRT5_BIOOC|nr:unnamed protein product [Clonostachys rosea]